jgi:hypothetical protein
MRMIIGMTVPMVARDEARFGGNVISRRALFQGAGLAAAAGAGAQEARRKIQVIVRGGHSGDPEYGRSGIVER